MKLQGPGAWPKCSSCSQGKQAGSNILTSLAAETGGCSGSRTIEVPALPSVCWPPWYALRDIYFWHGISAGTS